MVKIDLSEMEENILCVFVGYGACVCVCVYVAVVLEERE